MKPINFFHVGKCPICGQDVLKINKQLSDNVFYVSCDECLSEWGTPEEIKDSEKSTLNTYGPSQYATWEEIKEICWDKFVINKPASY